MKIGIVAVGMLVLISCNEERRQWLSQVEGLDFWEKLQEIESVSELPKSRQVRIVPDLIHLLRDEDQSVRVTAASELADISDVASEAIRPLINNFSYEHGEEDAQYVNAVSSFGRQALPQLEVALSRDDWLVRARACDAIREIAPGMYSDVECDEKEPQQVTIVDENTLTGVVTATFSGQRARQVAAVSDHRVSPGHEYA